MVSITERKASGNGNYLYKGVCLSTDIKPKLTNGSTLEELDTGKTYRYNEESEGWIGNADKYLASLTVTTAPTKTAYVEGDVFDKTGMVVKAGYTDNSEAAVTTYEVPETPLAVTDTKVTIKYTENGIVRTVDQEVTVAALALASIAITTNPTLAYSDGDKLDLTGMVVTATYNNDDTADVTAKCTTEPAGGATLATTDTTLTVSYTEGEVTKTTTATLTVT